MAKKETPAGWSRAVPQVGGYYWFVPVGYTSPVLAVVYVDTDGVRVVTHPLTRTGSGGIVRGGDERVGRWWGPIRPPDV